MRLVNWRALVVGAAGFGLAACGDDVTVTPPAPQITLNPTSVTCSPGQTTAVGVTVTGGSNTSVQFAAGGSGITVTANGASGATVVCGSTAGSAVINVTVTSGGQTYNSAIPVTITGGNTNVLAVQISPATATVSVGGTTQLGATVSLAPGAPSTTSTGVTWSTGDATIATVSSTGVVTGVKAGSTTITATSVANTNLKATIPVTVTAQSLVTSLTLATSTLTLQQGATSQIGATVQLAGNAPAGTSTGVTCTSSTTSVATISGGTTTPCTITAVAPGTSVITVRSVADTNVRQTIGLTVGPIAPVRLTISNISAVGPTGPSVDLNNTAGNLFITMNLDPGDNRPDSVVVTLGNQRVNCQKFSAQLADAYRAALQNGSADVQPITCQLNTAAFDTTSGVARVLNGQQPLTATVFYRPGTTGTGGTSTQQTAQIVQTLTVNNQSGFFVKVSNTLAPEQLANLPAGTQAANYTAVGPQGVTWRGGSISVAVLPVFFTGTPGTGNGSQQLTVSLTDGQFGPVVATKSATFTQGGNAPASVTFSGTTGAYTTTPANNTLTGYTSSGAGTAAGGTWVQLNGNQNTTFLTSSGLPTGANAFFVDNSFPEPRNQFVSNNFLVGAGPTGFLNGSFVFADSVQQAAAATALADNNGVDRVSRSFFVAPFTGGMNAGDIISGGTLVSNSSSLNQNISPTAFAVAANLVDALGNAVPVQVNAGATANLFTFGVITATPTISTVSAGTNIGSNAQIGITTTTARTIQLQASSAAGVSFPVPNFAIGTLSVLTPSGATYCATAADVDAGGHITGVSTTTAPPCPTIQFGSVNIDPTTARTGLYTLTAQARDVAGNLSATFTRTFVIDRTAPTVVNAFVATPPLTGGQPETFAATATDDFGLVSQLALVDYPTPTPSSNTLVFRYDGNALGTVLAAPFTKSANLSVTVPSFIRSVALQSFSAPNTFANVANNTLVTPDVASVGASDQGANWGYGTFPVAASLDQTQAAPAPFFGGVNGPTNASILFQSSTASSATTGGFTATLNAATAGNPTSETISLQLNGTVNTPFLSPFSKVELYIRSTIPGNTQGVNPFGPGTTTAYRLASACSAFATSVSAINNQTTITSSCPVVPGSGGIPSFPSAGSTTAVDLMVVASDANGNAVVYVIPTITLANP